MPQSAIPAGIPASRGCVHAARPNPTRATPVHEVILRGRDPRDARAFTERICHVCTGTHALTSVRAIEHVLGIAIPENADSIHNIRQLTLQAHDQLVHFHHLHALDRVDVVSAEGRG